MHLDDAGDDAGRRRLAIIEIMCDQQAELEEVRAWILQRSDALARGEFSLCVLLRRALGAPTKSQSLLEFTRRVRQFAQAAHWLPAHASCAWRVANHSLM